MVSERLRRHQQLLRASEVELHQILISELSKPNFGALGIFRLAHLIWGLDTPPRLTMLRVGTQWSEEQTSGRTALSDHLYHVISSHKHFWWARVGQSWPALAGVGQSWPALAGVRLVAPLLQNTRSSPHGALTLFCAQPMTFE